MLSRRLLVGCPRLDLVGVDMGVRGDRRKKQEQIAKEFRRFRLLLCASVIASTLVDDGWADFVFIDAGHSYKAVQSDIRVWLPKVRKGGWFGGHDYHEFYPGVMHAVDETFPKRTLLDYSVWHA